MMSRIVKLALLLLTFSLSSLHSEAQDDKNQRYYNQHPTEILPDAKVAFISANYERAEKLCKWYYIIVGNNSADELKDKSSRCAQLSAEMKELRAAGKTEAVLNITKEILALNPDDEEAKAVSDATCSQKGYMKIKQVSFANVDKAGNILTDDDGTLFKDEVRFIRPIIHYNGLYTENKSVELGIKIIMPDGTLSTSSNPDYSWTENKIISPGNSNTLSLVGWGTEGGGYYSEGTYTFEIWYNGNKLYSTTFDIEKSYLDIKRVLFANSDKSSTILTDYGGTLYKEDVKYVKPKIWYDGLATEEKKVNLDIKIYNPDGSLKTGSSSPSGYTWSEAKSVSAGKSNTFTLLGWGREDGGGYSAGTHTFEIWSNGNKLYSTSFVIKEKDNALSKEEWHTHLKKTMDNATFTYANGAYKGQADDEGRNGLGVYKWDSGSYYWGRWANGDMNGMAIYLITDGRSHVSNCSDCMYYVGYYSNDKKNGQGTCYDKYGNLIYYGNFSEGAPTETYPSSGYSEYKFQYYELANGDKYIGETKNGNFHGQGIYIWSNGDSWFGEWNNGQRNGYGLYMFYSGSVVYGKWVNNQQQ